MGCDKWYLEKICITNISSCLSNFLLSHFLSFFLRKFLPPQCLKTTKLEMMKTKKDQKMALQKQLHEEVLRRNQEKCRGGVTTDVMGWLKCGADGTLLVPGRASTLESVHETHTTHTDTHIHTRFTQVRGLRVEVTPLLLPVSLLFRGIRVTKCSLSCISQTQISI